MNNSSIYIAKEKSNVVSEVCGLSHRRYGLLKRLTRWYCRRKAYRRNRELFNNFLTLDDYLLEDIGFSREDVLWASSLPISESASRHLLERTKARKDALQNRRALSRDSN